MVTTNKKIYSRDTQKRKESKHRLKIVIKSQRKRAKEEINKKNYKTTPKQLTNWQ